MTINEAIERLKNTPCECQFGKSFNDCEYKKCVHKRMIETIVEHLDIHNKSKGANNEDT